MTIELQTLLWVAGGAAFVLWFFLRLTVFDAINHLRTGAQDQGRRIGALESRIDAWDAVESYKQRRRASVVHVPPEETPP